MPSSLSQRKDIVVEPSANGAQDLDTSVWDGWFDLDVQDSGAIMVGGHKPTLLH